jgi:hypothetical protein
VKAATTIRATAKRQLKSGDSNQETPIRRQRIDVAHAGQQWPRRTRQKAIEAMKRMAGQLSWSGNRREPSEEQKKAIEELNWPKLEAILRRSRGSRADAGPAQSLKC